MPKLKLDWKQNYCWVSHLNVINIHKSQKFVMYSRIVVDNPLSLMAPPTYVIDNFCMVISEVIWFEVLKMGGDLEGRFV